MLTTDTNPFKLTDSEKKFISDDWAWQFLRISPLYKEAYERVAIERVSSEELSKITDHFVRPQDATIVTHELAACREDFGLAVWLDPASKALPELKNEGSWFFPLKRLVTEDHRRRVVASEPLRLRNPPDAHSAPYPYLGVGETPFGYAPELRIMSKLHFDSLKPQQTFWVAVDCSIPPDGQMRALRTLAKHHKVFWRKYRLPSTRAVEIIIQSIASSERFAHMKFLRAHDRELSAPNTARLWRVVGINPLAPLEKQIAECQRLLRDIHNTLRESGELNRWFASAFPYSIRQRNASKNNNTSSDRISYLKALLTLAQHKDFSECDRECEQERQRRHEDGERDAEGDSPLLSIIAKDIGLRGPRAPTTGGWREDFESRLPFHLHRAFKTMDWGYRWLVHAQTFGHSRKQTNIGSVEYD